MNGLASATVELCNFYQKFAHQKSGSTGRRPMHIFAHQQLVLLARKGLDLFISLFFIFYSAPPSSSSSSSQLVDNLVTAAVIALLKSETVASARTRGPRSRRQAREQKKKKRGVTWISKSVHWAMCGSDVWSGLGLGGCLLAWRLAGLLVKVNKKMPLRFRHQSRNYGNQVTTF
ncbi:hypothetical protein BC937DRAFT_92481 [Endogone sp. FLAS-F59071]|nr:hypothetical protein BC937DRAFT_92481 [Endogone sp. FLAS-F59071]|eukprot:RUS15421.1 hypothetical protein BC937DRAFT_92481 [Endogone sp. FLAS-F59071]